MKHAAATFLAAVLTIAANAAPVRQATETWVTNKIDAIVGTNTAAKIASATNATLQAAKDYTDQKASGGAAANVIHYTRTTSTFEESAQTIAQFATTNQPLFCLVDNSLWFSLDNVVASQSAGVPTYTLTLDCDNPSNGAAGIFKPWIMTILVAPSANYTVAQIGQANFLAESYTTLTNSTAFRNAVAAVSPTPEPEPATNLWNVAGDQFLDGDLNLYDYVDGTAWTNDNAGGYAQIPAGLRFMPNGANRWTATKSGDTFDLYFDLELYRLMKNSQTAFPQSYRSGTAETTLIEFNDFKLYRFAIPPYIQKKDRAAKGSELLAVSNNVKQVADNLAAATTTDALKFKIGEAKATGVGLSSYGLVSLDPYQPLAVMSLSRWSNTTYPEVQAWTRGQIAANGMPGHGLVLTNGSVKTKAGGNVTAANIGAATPAEVSTAIENAGHMTQAAANAAYYPKAQGDAWSTYWDGDDVRVTVTNYDSAVRTPWLYLEQRTNETAQATNLFRTVWNEKTNWQQFLGNDWDWEGTWAGFKTWAANVAAQIADKADRAWGFYDSHTGTIAPDGFTSVSSSNVLICAGATYQKRVTSSAEVWVLTADEPYTATGAPATGGFQLKDGDGNVQFEIIKGDKVTVKAQASAVTVDGATLVVTYNVIAGTHPTGEVCLDLASPTWKAETAADCPATVSWSGTSGAYVARITPKQATTKCFFKATYQRGGDTYINNRCAVKMTQLVIGSTTYNVGTATISGNTVLTLTPAN